MKKEPSLLSASMPLIFAFIMLYGFISGNFFLSMAQGPSMSHHNREEFAINFIYKASDFKYGDKIFAIVDGKFLDKRVIGVPGDYVEVIDGVVYINGEKETKYAYNQTYNGVYREGEYLGEGEYFICGDNRGNSRDSEEFGPVKLSYKCINLITL